MNILDSQTSFYSPSRLGTLGLSKNDSMISKKGLNESPSHARVNQMNILENLHTVMAQMKNSNNFYDCLEEQAKKDLKLLLK